jgi:glycosyltransferase involved in cell wall biosynthesis
VPKRLPELTVVIPTHNRAALLDRCLAALAEQERPPPFDVRVAADGCADATGAVLESWRERLDLRSITLPGLGAAAARNAAAAHARGSVLVFLDDDCRPTPRCLAAHARDHRDGPAVVIGRLLPDDNNAPPWHRWHDRQLQEHYRSMLAGLRETGGKELYAGNFSVDRAAFTAVGGFDVGLPAAEDVDLGYRLQQHGLRFSFNPDAAAVHAGRHSLRAWRRRPFSYGQVDLVLASRGYGHSIDDLLQGYRELRPPLRLLTPAVRVGGPASWAARQVVWTAARLCGALGLEREADWGFSAGFTLDYWAGFWSAYKRLPRNGRHRQQSSAIERSRA